VVTPGFEWFVAWRHLREDPARRSRRTLLIGVVSLVVGCGWLLLAHFGTRWLHALLRASATLQMLVGTPPWFADVLQTAGVIAVAVGLLLTILGALLANFTVFTAISIFGVFLGTGAPIIALSVMSGFEADLKSKIRATKADVVISTTDDHPFTDWRAVDEKVASIDGVTASMAYLESEVIIKHASNPAGMGIILRGIDAPRAPRVLDLERTLSEGKVDFLLHPEQIPADDVDDSWGAADAASASSGSTSKVPPGDAELHHAAPARGKASAAPAVPGILLGDELYTHTLHVFVGSDVDVACPMCGVGPSGPMPKLKSFRVAGHFYTGMYEFDSKLAYVSLPEAQKFLGLPGEVTGIEVRTANADRAHDVAEAISARIGPGYEVRSWEELNRGLFMALKLEKIAMFVVLTFIALVASFSIVSNLIMLVTEKGREVAILKSMGARDRAILRVFFAEGLYIGLLGLGLGLGFGIGGCLLIARFGLPLNPDVYYIQKLPVVMRLGEIASVGVAALGLCCLATLYPAYLASRMRPVEGLRYE
jgi:lipoprotein-releasing system permease protein